MSPRVRQSFRCHPSTTIVTEVAAQSGATCLASGGSAGVTESGAPGAGPPAGIAGSAPDGAVGDAARELTFTLGG